MIPTALDVRKTAQKNFNLGRYCIKKIYELDSIINNAAEDGRFEVAVTLEDLYPHTRIPGTSLTFEDYLNNLGYNYQFVKDPHNSRQKILYLEWQTDQIKAGDED